MRRDLLAGFLLATIAILVLAGAGYYASERAASATSWVGHTYLVREALGRARADLLELQTGLSVFALTGAEPDLAPYNRAVSELRGELDGLRAVVSDNPGQLARIAELDLALKARLDSALGIIEARRARGLEAARAMIGDDASRLAVARLGGVLDALDAEERRLLEARNADEQAVQAWIRITVAVFVATLIAALAFLYRTSRQRQAHEEALLRSEERFHLMARSVVDYAILLLDTEGRIASWNAGAERIKGWREDEIVGEHFSRFYPPADVAAGKPQAELGIAAAEGRFEEEGWRVRKDGNRFWANVVITAVRDSNGALIGYGKVTRDLTERKNADDALREEVAQRRIVEAELSRLNSSLEKIVEERTAALQTTNADLLDAKNRLHDLSARLITAQEEERKRISRELHDETGQALTGIRLRLTDAIKNTDHRQSLQECVVIVDQAVAHVRNLAINLRPLMLDDLGLADALEWALDQQAKAAGWSASLDADEIPALAEDVQTACFRIGQEALTNAARHAHASEVLVRLRVNTGRLELDIVDNGRGFEPDAFVTPEERRSHFGLVSMSERADLVGGRFEIESAPGQGTRVRASFPLASAH